MKVYALDPAFEMLGDARTAAAVALSADIILECLRADGDTFHFALTSSGPIRLETENALREWLLASINPFVAAGGDVRSASNCRCVTFGYDGQAFLCLRHDDPAPESRDTNLVLIEERSHYLAGTDYLDGWIGLSA